ncbi:MAG TPA: hypothetical protein VFV93_13970 [Thermomicrobiales bacterium]|nr:hypothetical protein [Thermomicrobiales bacterium]
MRFVTRRMLVALMLVVLLLPAVIACGGGDDDDENPTATTSGEAATATEATAGEATATAAGDADATGTSPSAATSTTGTDATTPPTGDSAFAYGWNVAVRGDDGGAEHNVKTIEAVQDSGFGWVRFQLEWNQFERADNQWDPLPIDRKVDQIAGSNLKILLVVAKAPDWALDPSGNQLLADYGQFQELMQFVSQRYAGKVQAWEIWNEQNLAYEVNGTVRVNDYVDLLKAGYEGVRAGDPNALVVFGGLTPNGVNDPSVAIDDVEYLTQIYQVNGGEIANYFDVLGMHVSSTHNPPDTMWPDNPSDEEGYNDDESFYFRRAEQLWDVLVANGDSAKPVWITEFGWTTANQAPGYEYGVNNTEQEVADYLVRSFEIARTEWSFVTGMFVWNLNWSTLTTPDDEKYPWSALNEDWTPRPAYDALKAMPKT